MERGQRQITITEDMFEDMLHLREELDSLVESIAIMNDPKLAEGISRSRRDLKGGRVGTLKDVDEIDAW
jgi:hypothetical protein